MVTDFGRERHNELCIAMKTKESSAPTRRDEDDVDAEYSVRQPGVEAVEGSHFQRGVKHTSSIRHTDTHRSGTSYHHHPTPFRLQRGVAAHLMASSTDWPMMFEDGPGWDRGVRLMIHLTGL